MSDDAGKKRILSLTEFMDKPPEALGRDLVQPLHPRHHLNFLALRSWEVEAQRRLIAFQQGQISPRPWVSVQKAILELLGIEPPIQFLAEAVEDAPVTRAVLLDKSAYFEMKIARTLARVAAEPETAPRCMYDLYRVAIDDTEDYVFYEYDGTILTVLAIARHDRMPPRSEYINPLPFVRSVAPPSLPLMASPEMGASRRGRDGK